MRQEQDALYYTWKAIRGRCLDPKDPQFKNYGDKGTPIEPAWDKFVPFRDYVRGHLGDKPNGDMSLLMIDGDKGYVPGNLVWGQRKRGPRAAYEKYAGDKVTCEAKGVTFDKHNPVKPFKAQIIVNGRLKHVGYYRTEEEAAIAYQKKEKELSL